MPMKNYKVVQADGEATYYQFDDADEAGKAGLAALQRAAKDNDNPVKSVTEGEPEPINKGGSK